MKILVSSRSEAALKNLRARIPNIGSYQTELVLMANGHADALMLVDYRPDVLVLHAGEHVCMELRALAGRPAADRPALVVVGDRLSTDAMKYAMRAGARDFIGEQEAAELAESLRRLESELEAHEATRRARVISVVNGKGGSGGTFLATSLAHAAATRSGGGCLIIDLDFQYGPIPHYLDLEPKRGLMQALASAPELDEVAARAYTTVHDSGLRVMAPVLDLQPPPEFDVAERMAVLLRVLEVSYDSIFVDVPRHLDDVAATVLQASETVLIVVQQSLLSVHDAVRLKTILTRELAIPAERISVVLNRHDKHAALSARDVGRALDQDDLTLVPNHYKLVSQSLDMGVPVLEQAPGSAVAKALVGLHGRLMGGKGLENRGFLAKTMQRLRVK